MKIIKINSLCTRICIFRSVCVRLYFINQNCNEPINIKLVRKVKYGHNITFFIFKAIYILIWTFILDNYVKMDTQNYMVFIFVTINFYVYYDRIILLVASRIMTLSSIKESMTSNKYLMTQLF